MSRPRPTLAVLLALAALAAPSRADEQAGIRLAREARGKLSAGEAQAALELLDRARIEWPGAPQLANTRADALRELGRYDEAIAEYERGDQEPCHGHARFNRAVTRHLSAETALTAAGVPADVGALPEGPQPQMLAALADARPHLLRAVDDFLSALDEDSGDAEARQSVGALHRRLDALQRIEDELKQRQEEQEQEEQQDEPQEPGEEPNDEQDPDGEPQDRPPQDGEGEERPPEESPPQEQEGEGQPPESAQGEAPEPLSGLPRQLSAAELQQLLDKLDQLEREARALQKAREAARHRSVEKDW